MIQNQRKEVKEYVKITRIKVDEWGLRELYATKRKVKQVLAQIAVNIAREEMRKAKRSMNNQVPQNLMPSQIN